METTVEMSSAMVMEVAVLERPMQLSTITRTTLDSSDGTINGTIIIIIIIAS